MAYYFDRLGAWINDRRGPRRRVFLEPEVSRSLHHGTLLREARLKEAVLGIGYWERSRYLLLCFCEG